MFYDDFGDNSSAVTKFTSPPFDGTDIVIVGNSICASTCSIFSSFFYQKHGVRTVAYGGVPGQDLSTASVDGGIKGPEVTSLDGVLSDLKAVGLSNDPAAPQPLPINAAFNINYRNAIPYIHREDDILEFVFEGATQHYQYTPETYNNPQAIWEFTAEQIWGGH